MEATNSLNMSAFLPSRLLATDNGVGIIGWSGGAGRASHLLDAAQVVSGDLPYTWGISPFQGAVPSLKEI